MVFAVATTAIGGMLGVMLPGCQPGAFTYREPRYDEALIESALPAIELHAYILEAHRRAAAPAPAEEKRTAISATTERLRGRII